MNRFVKLTASQCFMLLACLTCIASQSDDASDQAVSEFDNPVLPLEAARERSEAEADRVAASAMYAHGRLLIHREDYAGALRRFQRAWRYDANSVTILDEILMLAQGLRRSEELARYAVIAQEENPDNIEMIDRLAEMLTANRDFERALELYESSLELREQDGDNSGLIVQKMNMGRLYFLTQQFKKSADAFAAVREALENPSKFGLNRRTQRTLLGEAHRTYLLLAESFFQAKRYDDAEQMFRKANEAKRDKALLALNLARIDAAAEQVDAALAYLQEYFDAQGESGGREPFVLLEELLVKKLGDEQQAKEEVYRRLTKIQGNDPNTARSLYLAELAEELDKAEAAEEIYQQLLDDEPTIGVYQRLVDLYRQKDQVDSLLEMLSDAVAMAADVVQTITLDTLGDEIENLARDDELVATLIEAATKQIEDETDSDGLSLGIALIALEAQRFDDADRFFERALDERDADQFMLIFSWAFNLYLAEQYDRAATIFQRGIDEGVAPENNLDIYYYYVGALAYAGKTERALKVAERAIELSPDAEELEGQIPWILFRTRLPWVYYQAKQYEAAENAYLAFLEQFDSDYSSSLVRQSVRDARLVMSNICVFQDRPEEAEEWLEQVLDEFPEDIGAFNDLGYLWADQGKRLNRALVMVRRAVKNEPNNIAYLDSLGWAYYRLGRYEDALTELEKAAAGEDTDGVILDHLGDAYLKTNRRRKAIATWKRAVEAFKKSEELKLLDQTSEKIKRHSTE